MMPLPCRRRAGYGFLVGAGVVLWKPTAATGVTEVSVAWSSLLSCCEAQRSSHAPACGLICPAQAARLCYTCVGRAMGVVMHDRCAQALRVSPGSRLRPCTFRDGLDLHIAV